MRGPDREAVQMSYQERADVPTQAGRKTSSVIMIAALIDLLVILPYSYWRFRSHPLALTVAVALEGTGILVLLGIALYLRRRGS
jgi:hypothetical protein